MTISPISSLVISSFFNFWMSRSIEPTSDLKRSWSQGRFSSAFLRPASSLSRRYGSRLPSRFTSARSSISISSTVEKRYSHSMHSRRRRMLKPSDVMRESTTLVSSKLQTGQRIRTANGRGSLPFSNVDGSDHLPADERRDLQVLVAGSGRGGGRSGVRLIRGLRHGLRIAGGRHGAADERGVLLLEDGRSGHRCGSGGGHDGRLGLADGRERPGGLCRDDRGILLHGAAVAVVAGLGAALLRGPLGTVETRGDDADLEL